MAKLCAKGKAAAKRKFKVYPSAYANMYAAGVCSGRIKKETEYHPPVGYDIFNKILATVSKHFNVAADDIMSRRRLNGTLQK